MPEKMQTLLGFPGNEHARVAIDFATIMRFRWSGLPFMLHGVREMLQYCCARLQAASVWVCALQSM
jgi:hypothetical protein